jgi:hypothetical protein
MLAFGNREGPERAPEILAQMGERSVCAGVGELPGYGGVLDVVNRVQVEEMANRESYVNVRGERVEDLVCAHVGVGVDDTLAAALHVARYERGIGAMAGVRAECALAPSNVGEIDS